MIKGIRTGVQANAGHEIGDEEKPSSPTAAALIPATGLSDGELRDYHISGLD